MTISSTTSRIGYSGSGSVGPFAYPFKINAETDLLVTKRSSAGAETVLAWPADFTVTGVLNATGGTITLTTALPTGFTLYIRRRPPLTQATSIRNQGAYFASVHEDEFDRLVMQLQSLSDAIDRTPKLKETISGSPALTELEPTNGSVLTGTGSGFTMSPLSPVAGVVLPGQGRTNTSLSAYLLNNSVFNVQDFPNASGTLVTGNGVTDDTTGIQVANAAAHVAGGVLYFPQAVAYKVVSTPATPAISITSPLVEVVGASMKGVKIKDTGTGATFSLNPVGIGGIAIRNLHVESTTNAQAFKCTTAYEVIFEHVWVNGCGGDCWKMDTCIDAMWRDCHITGSTLGHGVISTGAGENNGWKFIGSRFAGSYTVGKYGVGLSNGTVFTAVGLICESWDYCIRLGETARVQAVSLEGCYFEDYVHYAVFAATNVINGGSIKGCYFAGKTIATSEGIYCGANNFIIGGNRFSTNLIDIEINASAVNVTVLPNSTNGSSTHLSDSGTGTMNLEAKQTGVSAMTNVPAVTNLDATTVTTAQLAAIVGNLINKLRVSVVGT